MRTPSFLRKDPETGKLMISLRARLILAVTAEMVVSILVSFGIAEVWHWIFGENLKAPLLLELILVSLLIGVFVTNMLSRYFFGPIKKLRSAMSKVEQGDLTVKLDDSNGPKEIRDVNAGFNLMVDGLKSTETLQADFISCVSHEFKTPLNAIEGYTTLLQGCENLDETQQLYVEKILFNTKRLSDLAGSILFMSKIENQTIPTNQKLFDLDEQIRQSVLSLEAMWEPMDFVFVFVFVCVSSSMACGGGGNNLSDFENDLGNQGQSNPNDFGSDVVPVSVFLSASNLELDKGEEYQLYAIVSPSSAVQTVEFISLNESIATVDENGKVVAISQGSTVVYAETQGIFLQKFCTFGSSLFRA